MKIITISKVGYNMPSQANWSYGIWKLDLIDTDTQYNMSHTMKENFGGDSRIRARVRADLKVEILETKGIYTDTGTPKISGVRKMIDLESEESFQIIKEFLTK